MRSTSPVELVRVHGPERRTTSDQVVTEEPVEIRLDGERFAVIMRTPGADLELAAGFLLAERVIRGAEDVGAIDYCRDPDAANVVNVMLADGARPAAERALVDRRRVTANASCGVCGRVTIDDLRADLRVVSDGIAVPSAAIVRLPRRLREAQPLFALTGGLHAAGLFAIDSTPSTTGDPLAAMPAVPVTGQAFAGLQLIASAEDVGRHNAVDKIVGRMLMRDALPLSSHVLCVSGRTSFEIVQKAWCAGIPIVASVSAPSSLAVDVAREAGITLVGFVRDGAFNLYTHPERIV